MNDSVTECLNDFPAQWDYRFANNEERDKFMAVIGRVIGEEEFRGLRGTQGLDELLAAARAQQLKPYIVPSRDKLKLMVAAHQFVNEHPEDGLIRDADRTTKAAEKAAAKLREAQEASDRATAEKRAAESQVERYRQSQKQLDTGDLVHRAAFDRHLELTHKV